MVPPLCGPSYARDVYTMAAAYRYVVVLPQLYIAKFRRTTILFLRVVNAILHCDLVLISLNDKIIIDTVFKQKTINCFYSILII